MRVARGLGGGDVVDVQWHQVAGLVVGRGDACDKTRPSASGLSLLAMVAGTDIYQADRSQRRGSTTAPAAPSWRAGGRGTTCCCVTRLPEHLRCSATNAKSATGSCVFGGELFGDARPAFQSSREGCAHRRPQPYGVRQLLHVTNGRIYKFNVSRLYSFFVLLTDRV